MGHLAVHTSSVARCVASTVSKRPTVVMGERTTADAKRPRTWRPGAARRLVANPNRRRPTAIVRSASAALKPAVLECAASAPYPHGADERVDR